MIYERTHWETFQRNFILGAMASCTAVTFSNPAEVVKTRMQIQGQFCPSSVLPAVRYRNVVEGFLCIYRVEGLRGLQRGLAAAYGYQVALNGTRLSIDDALKRWAFYRSGRAAGATEGLEPVEKRSVDFFDRIACAAVAGACGAFVASPLYLIKTRLQARSEPEYIAYRGLWDGLNKVYSRGGIRALFYGARPAMLRTVVGSCTQLSTFDYAKNYLEDSSTLLGSVAQRFCLHPLSLSGLSAFIASVALVICLNPFDVIVTRTYNTSDHPASHARTTVSAGKESCVAMNNGMSTFRRARLMFHTEGFGGFYKGIGAHYVRIAPHTVLTLFTFDFLKNHF